MSIPRPLLQKDLDAAYERFARMACAIVNEGREAYPQVFFVQMDDADPGIITNFCDLNPSTVLRLNNAGTPGKRLLTALIAASLGDVDAFPLRQGPLLETGLRADIAVQVSEVWTVPQVPNDDALNEIPPSERTDRAEGLLVLAHVKGHTTGQMMPITTSDGRRHVEFAPLLNPRGGIIGGNIAMQGWDDVPEGLTQ